MILKCEKNPCSRLIWLGCFAPMLLCQAAQHLQAELEGAGGDEEAEALNEMLGGERGDIENMELLHARFVEAAAERQRSAAHSTSQTEQQGEQLGADHDVDEEALERFMNQGPQDSTVSSSSSRAPASSAGETQTVTTLSAGQSTTAFQRWSTAASKSREAIEHMCQVARTLLCCGMVLHNLGCVVSEQPN